MMDYSKYIELIQSGNYDEAVAFKNSFIPDVLYKYYCLDRRHKLNDVTVFAGSENLFKQI